MSNPAAPKANTEILVILGVLIVGVIAAFGYMQWKAYAQRTAIHDWITTNPVNAMILERHPATYPRFVQHFTPYYEKQGALGLEEGQIEMLQIAHVNYLTDYIWQIGDRELDDFLNAQFKLTAMLVRNTKDNGLCEQYYGDSSLYNSVRAAVGDDIFVGYMKTIERLFLSAKVSRPREITPSSRNYAQMTRAAGLSILLEYTKLYPGATLQSIYGFDPTKSCRAYASYLRTLLTSPQSNRSLVWRAAMEAERPKAEAARRARGSE